LRSGAGICSACWQPEPPRPSTGVSTPAQAGSFPDKRKARYQADSSNVQNFYRVNRYPAK